MRHQLCPPFSRLHSPQETCSLTPRSSLSVLPSVAEFAERGKSQLLQGLLLLAKWVGRRLDTWKLLPVLHTPIPHPAVINPKICTRQDWLSDLRLLGDRESNYPITGKTDNQSQKQVSTWHTSEATPDP